MSQPAWRAIGRPVAALSLAPLLLAAMRGVAHACGSAAVVDVAWGIVETWPSQDESDVALDTAIVFEVESWPALEPLLALPSRESFEVVMTDADGREVAGLVSAFGTYGNGLRVFRPKASLHPDATYRVRATVRGALELDRDARARPDVDFTFVTGSAPWPALDLGEGPRLAFESYVAPAARCESGARLTGQQAAIALRLAPGAGCPAVWTGCVPDGEAEATRARLTLGPVAGGQSTHPYSVSVTVTADQPEDGQLRAESLALLSGGQTMLAAGEAHTFVLDVPELGEPYAPCVSVVVRDVTGENTRWWHCGQPGDAGADDGEASSTLGERAVRSMRHAHTAPDAADAGIDASLTEMPRPAVGACELGAPGRRSGAPACALLATATLSLRRRRQVKATT